jgi:hypothetical protein
MRKEDLSIDTTFDPCQSSLDSTFNVLEPALNVMSLVFSREAQKVSGFLF